MYPSADCILDLLTYVSVVSGWEDGGVGKGLGLNWLSSICSSEAAASVSE